MKKNYLFALCAVMALFSACSSDDGVGVEGGKIPGFNSEGNGFISLNLNLPSRSSASRASNSNNDQFDDGLPSEYAVKNGTLILFKSDESFHSAYNLNLIMNSEPDDPNQITKTSRLVTVNAKDEAPKYALVVLNHNGLFTISGNDLTINSNDNITIPAADADNFNKTKNYANFMKVLAKNATILTGQGFFMTNAVLANKPGTNSERTGAAATTLVEVSGMIYDNKTDAEANAAEIYVERAVAKVQLNTTEIATAGETGLGGVSTASYEGITLTTTPVTASDFKYEVTGWKLANINTKSYLVRNWSSDEDKYLSLKSQYYPEAGTNPYRFAGTNPVRSGVSLFRTYWGIDPNYDTDAPTGDLITPAALSTNYTQYCMENTFKVGQQKVKNTTCAIVEVTFKPTSADFAKGFHTLGGEPSILYTHANAEHAVGNIAYNKFLADVLPKFKANGCTHTEDASKYKADAVITERLTSGKCEVTSVIFKCAGCGSSDPKTIHTVKLSDDECDEVAKAADVEFYKDSKAYYIVPIMHFGEELTPWAGPSAEHSFSESYPSLSEDNWLGRYGLLRNNWYELALSKVTRIGSAEVPDPKSEDWDDELEKYLAVKINVLSWAKRTQSVDLK